MPTESFDKKFIVTDNTSIARIKKDLANPRKVVVASRDYEKEKRRGLAKLKQRLTHIKSS